MYPVQLEPIDLTWPIGAATKLFPGMPRPAVERVKEHGDKGVQVSRLTITVHAGTHLDAPRHFLATGATVAELPLARLMGPARVVRLDAIPGRPVAREELAGRAGTLAGGEILVLDTGYAGLADDTAYRWLAPEAAAWLAEAGIKCLGLDSPSVDPVSREPFYSARTHPSHHALLGAGVPIAECLANLAALPAERFFFCCVPLGIEGAEAAPARVFALPLAPAAAS